MFRKRFNQKQGSSKKEFQIISAAHQGRICGVVDMLDVVDMVVDSIFGLLSRPCDVQFLVPDVAVLFFSLFGSIRVSADMFPHQGSHGWNQSTGVSFFYL